MFEEFFGDASPALIATVFSGITQMIKTNFNVQDKWLKVGVFVANLAYVLPYYVSLQPEITVPVVLKGILYGLGMGVWCTGFWATFLRGSEKPRE